MGASRKMITELVITNFRGIQGMIHFPVAKSGLMLLNGMHNCDYADSNGAGKSSIYLALLWCLYGYTGDQTAKEVVNKDSDYCQVSATFVIHGIPYTITRTREKSTTELLFMKNGKIRGDNKDVRSVQADIIKELGVPLETFLLTLVSDGEHSFITLNDAKQKKLMEGLLEFDVSHLKGGTQNRSGEIALRQQEINTLLSNKTAAAEASDGLIQTAADNVTVCAKALDKVRLHVDQERTRLSGELEWAKNEAQVRRQAQSEASKQHSETLQKLEANHSFLRTASNNYGKWMRERTRYEITMQERVQQYEAILSTTVNCDRCGLPFTPDSKNFYFQKLKADHAQEQATHRLRVGECNTQLQASRTYLVNNQWIQGDDPRATDKIYKDLIQDVTNKKEAELQAMQQITDQHAPGIAEIDNKVIELNGKLTACTTELSKAQYAHDQAVSQHNRLLNQKQQQQDAVDAEELLSERHKLEHEQTVLEAVEKAYRKDGLPAYIISNHLPAVESLANQYLCELSPSALQITLRVRGADESRSGSLLVTATNTEGAESYAGLSKGEKKRIEVVLMLALRRVVVDNHFDPGILFLDELIDGVDAKGMQAMIEFLTELSKETQIIVISHKQAMDSYFQDVVTIVRERGKDTILR